MRLIDLVDASIIGLKPGKSIELDESSTPKKDAGITTKQWKKAKLPFELFLRYGQMPPAKQKEVEAAFRKTYPNAMQEAKKFDSKTTIKGKGKDGYTQNLYDLGMGYMGNGLTVWNRAIETDGDYTKVAHIQHQDGKITWLDKSLPLAVKKEIEKIAKGEKKAWDKGTHYYQHMNEALSEENMFVVTGEIATESWKRQVVSQSQSKEKCQKLLAYIKGELEFAIRKYQWIRNARIEPASKWFANESLTEWSISDIQRAVKKVRGTLPDASLLSRIRGQSHVGNITRTGLQKAGLKDPELEKIILALNEEVSKKFIVTGEVKELGWKRDTISEPMSKIAALEFRKHVEMEVHIAIEKYRWVRKLSIESAGK